MQPAPPAIPAAPARSSRPSAGFTWMGLLSIWIGYIAVAVIVCGFAGVNALINGDTPPDPDGPTPAEDRTITVVIVVAAIAFVAASAGAVLAARKHNLRLGETAGRPRPTWRIFLSPRGLSRLLFSPSGVYQIDDPLIGRLGLARSLAGVVVFVMVVAYRDPGALDDYGEQLFIQTSNAIVVAVMVLLVCEAVLLALVPADQRRAAVRALARPLLAVLSAGVILGSLLAMSFVGSAPPSSEPRVSDRREDFIALLMSPHILWVFAFIVFAVFYIARNMFNSADAHPILAPVVTVAVTWTLTLLNLAASAGVTVRLPVADLTLPISATLAAVMSIGGATTVTLLAWWEIARIRAQGLSLRAGPWR